ncbi:MAG: carboxymuconolactone decarboxylase family protein [Bacteroidales bacterium]|nr:carboxymuconolactone decarboxylase family protein [Bacteroidales bacterium]
MDEFNKKRIELNNLLSEQDHFFTEFGLLDDQAYSDGAIPKVYKELTGLSISVFSKCEECIYYHLQNCVDQKATKAQIIEAIKLGVIGAGSTSYPWARKAIAYYIEHYS